MSEVAAVNPLVTSVEDVKAILMDAVRQGILESAMSENPFPEKVRWALKPKFNTACWSFQDPTHQIYLGEGCLRNARPHLTRDELVDYALAYIRHERDGHGRYTIRTMKEIKHLLRPLPGVRTTPIPFPLFNLFADARIEHLIRVVDGTPLGWRRFEEKANKVMPSASGAFFLLIQAETEDAAPADEWLEFEAKEKPERLERVMHYYKRVIACETEWDLRPIMLEWLEEFAEESSPDNQKQSGLGDSELQQGYQLGEDANAAAAFNSDTESLSEEPNQPSKSLERGEENSKSSRDGGTGELLHSSRAILDEHRIKALVGALRKAFVGPSRTRDTDEPGPGLALHNLLPGGDATVPFCEKKRRGRAKRKVAIVLDCSGSMGSENTDPMGYGRELVAALSDLARSGLVSGWVMLTAVVGGAARWERFKLPMTRNDICRMQGFAGAEGIAHALESNVTTFRQAHRVFLYSDGCITDRQPNKQYLRTQGVEVIGLYCGEADAAEDLAKHVKRCIVRKTPEDLALAMLKELKGI